LIKVPIPAHCSNADYEAAMGAAMARARDQGIRHVAFGDLFLEDIRKYREEKLRAVGMTPLFPIWGRETAALAREMVARGLRAHLTCVDPKQLDRRFAGRLFDADLLDELPPGVDACGENGEFHSFAFGGPMFLQPVRVALGEIVERDAFVFADLLNADAP
jgi:diphthamide synthase (EF-2-diphthine--ammonia ligase)